MTTDQSDVDHLVAPPGGSVAEGRLPPGERAGAPSAHRSGRLLRADVLVVVVAVVLALLGGFLATRLAPVSYETGAKVLFTPSPDGEASTAGQSADLVSAQVPTWAALAQTPAVLDDAVKTSGLSLSSTEAVDAVDAAALADTSIVEITATGPSAQEAAVLASATATSLVTQVEERSSVGGAPLTTGSVVEQPPLPSSPGSPSLLVNLGVALAVGLAVGLGVVVARRALLARRRTA